ncbi:MAG TPA: MOSC domain-containing protein [Lysobacter sp.]|nr:MOSC domain-containing protein [Lysobacter sp.]
MRLSSLYLYPMKSCAPLPCTEAAVEPRGLAHDRRWMVVDDDGRFLTGRQLATMVRIQARPAPDGGLVLAADAGTPLHVPVPGAGERISVTVWDSTVDARPAGAAADAWLSGVLGRAVRLVHMDGGARRAVSEKYAQPGDEVSFADGFPLLLISQAALDHLNAKLPRPVAMTRFRPNLVVDGTAAHAEDGWRRIRIGAVEFDVVKPCTRCVFTTVDPERGERDASGEPLRTLLTYRRTPKGVTFGQNLIPRGTGTLRLGDPVTVLA